MRLRPSTPVLLLVAELLVAQPLATGCSTSAEASATPLYTPRPKYHATNASFDGFPTWPRVAVAEPTLPTDVLPGPSYVYRSGPEPSDDRHWPIGTLLIKTVEPSPDPRDWTIHAMVRRGEPFNEGGAVGWEFFGLALDERGDATILWRSDGSNDGHAYGGVAPDGDGPRERSCNDCHARSWRTDSVLSPGLR